MLRGFNEIWKNHPLIYPLGGTFMSNLNFIVTKKWGILKKCC